MRRIILAATLLAALPAMAGEYRTVTWFADHPRELEGVLRLCRDNVGLAKNIPNCVNAEQAQFLVVERELNLSLPADSPLTARYWQNNPTQRSGFMSTCVAIDKTHAVPDKLTAQMCVAARAAGG